MKRFVMFALLGGLLLGCFTDISELNTDPDVVVTVKKPSYDFTVNKSFYLPEKLYDLADYQEDALVVDHRYDQLILNRIATHMAGLGYTRVVDPAAADVVVTASYVAMNNWYFSSYYWWDPWYYYYSWWYYYPPVVTAVNIPIGSLIITMADPKTADEVNKTVSVSWAAALVGLIDDVYEMYLIEQIEQAFSQSDYLRTGSPVTPLLDPEQTFNLVGDGEGGQP